MHVLISCWNVTCWLSKILHVTSLELDLNKMMHHLSQSIPRMKSSNRSSIPIEHVAILSNLYWTNNFESLDCYSSSTYKTNLPRFRISLPSTISSNPLSIKWRTPQVNCIDDAYYWITIDKLPIIPSDTQESCYPLSPSELLPRCYILYRSWSFWNLHYWKTHPWRSSQELKTHSWHTHIQLLLS